MNYKISVKNEAESREVQGLFFELGYKWFSGGKKVQHLEQSCSSSFGYLVASSGCFTDVIQCGCGNEDAKEITLPDLRDMVVLKRNNTSDATHENSHGQSLLKVSNGWYIFNTLLDVWEWNGEYLVYQPIKLKPITKEPTMKEYLNKLEDGTYKLVVLDSVADGVKGLIEVPDGADTLAGDERTRYFWKHRVGVKGNMLIGCGESLSRYPKWDDCEDSADEWLGQINCEHSRILWQRETLNDKVASAEVARQEFIGAPFSYLSAFNFGAIDDFVESNVEKGVKHSHYKKDISHLNTLDIYRVTELFNPHSCGAHIAKKALCSGQRGHKDLLTDIQDIIDTAERWKEMLIEDEKAK